MPAYSKWWWAWLSNRCHKVNSSLRFAYKWTGLSLKPKIELTLTSLQLVAVLLLVQMTSGLRHHHHVTSTAAVKPRGKRILEHVEITGNKTFPWIAYDATQNKVFCELCSNAKDMLPATTPEQESYKVFVKDGFSSWSKALERLASVSIASAASAGTDAATA